MPPFLNAIHQPVDNPTDVGNVIVLLPPCHTNEVPRLLSEITGTVDMRDTFDVTASLPEMVVSPAPCNVAASADDVPAPNVTFCQIPAGVVLSER